MTMIRLRLRRTNWLVSTDESPVQLAERLHSVSSFWSASSELVYGNPTPCAKWNTVEVFAMLLLPSLSSVGQF